MTDENLTELLDEAADRVPVGPAPVAAMVAKANRVRRRRTAALAVASAAATVAVVGTASALWPTGGSSETPPPLVASPEPDIAPPGTRLVGLASAAVAVPQEWGTNVTGCGGIPLEDTVIIDLGFVPDCGAPRPVGVDSVKVSQGEPWSDFTADETVEIDGVSAQRRATACQPDLFDESVSVCVGIVYIPSMGVFFRAESSTSAEEVDGILEQIRILPDRAGVPGYKEVWLPNEPKEGERIYLDMLREAGLAAEVRMTNARPVGSVVDVSPAPGTMLKRGDVVTVTVAVGRESPAG